MTIRFQAVQRLASPRPRLAEIIFWLLPAALYFLFPYDRALALSLMTYAIAVLGLDLVLGYAGIVSLGHAAFFGIGAYTAGLLSINGWREPLSGLLIAGALTLAIGYLTNFLVVRGKDLTRLMVTLGICLLAYELANRMSGVTGGMDGLSLRAIREGVDRMPALGASVNNRLRVAFTLSAGIAGIAGGLMAQTTQFVGVDSLSVTRSAEFLVMLVLGGTGRLYGAVIGTAVFVIAHDFLNEVNPVYWEFWMGVLLMAVVLFLRGGLTGGASDLARFVASKGLPTLRKREPAE